MKYLTVALLDQITRLLGTPIVPVRIAGFTTATVKRDNRPTRVVVMRMEGWSMGLILGPRNTEFLQDRFGGKVIGSRVGLVSMPTEDRLNAAENLGTRILPTYPFIKIIAPVEQDGPWTNEPCFDCECGQACDECRCERCSCEQCDQYDDGYEMGRQAGYEAGKEGQSQPAAPDEPGNVRWQLGYVEGCEETWREGLAWFDDEQREEDAEE